MGPCGLFADLPLIFGFLALALALARPPSGFASFLGLFWGLS